MEDSSNGKTLGLQDLASPDGRLAILALDHRDSLVRSLGLAENDPFCHEAMQDFKLAILANLLEHASAALVDPEYIDVETVARAILPARKGLVVALERSGYQGEPNARLTELLPDRAVGKLKRIGVSAVKVLLYYNPFAGGIAEQQERLVLALIQEAHAVGLPLLVEPISYPPDPVIPKRSPDFAAMRPHLVIESARKIGALGADVLKLEFPHDSEFNDDEAAWADACAALNEAAAVPWVLLSAGVDYETFCRQVKMACQAGACGFAAGRAIWQEATDLHGEERDTFLRGTGNERMAELTELAREYGRPWTDYRLTLA